MKIVFLHGIVDGDPNQAWLRALNSALESEGHPPIADSQVCAPRYSSLLAVEGISAKMLGFVVDKQIGGATAITAGQ